MWLTSNDKDRIFISTLIHKMGFFIIYAVLDMVLVQLVMNYSVLYSELFMIGFYLHCDFEWLAGLLWLSKTG